MRRTFIKLTLAVAALLIIGGADKASAQKFGYIDLQELIGSMPELNQVQDRLRSLEEEMQAQFNTMVEEFQRRREDLQRTSEGLTESVRNFREQELQELLQRIQSFEENAQSQMSRKQAELLEPLFDKAQVAVNNVAVEQGLMAVFAVGAMVYFDPATMVDVLPLAKKWLGIN